MPAGERTRPGRRLRSARWCRTAALVVCVAVVPLVACDREEPVLREAPTTTVPPFFDMETSGLEAGPATATASMRNPYEGNAWALGDGERLYGWFNCDGCHGPEGGGGIGPPFADDDWIYGGRPLEIFQSIVQGRPEGMPAFAGKIPEPDVWKIVLFVRSLAGHGADPPQAGGPGGE